MSERCWRCGDDDHSAEQCPDPEPPKWADIDVINPEWLTWQAARRSKGKAIP